MGLPAQFLVQHMPPHSFKKKKSWNSPGTHFSNNILQLSRNHMRNERKRAGETVAETSRTVREPHPVLKTADMIHCIHPAAFRGFCCKIVAYRAKIQNLYLIKKCICHYYCYCWLMVIGYCLPQLKC